MDKKIIFLTPALGKGGAETQLVKLALHLRQQGMQVLIISLKEINDFHLDLNSEGIETIFLKNNWLAHFYSNFKTLIKSVKNFKPDVIIAFMFIAIIVGRLLKYFMRFKLISSVRASRIDLKWREIFRVTSRLDDLLVYNSNASKEIFENNRLVKTKGIVITNAINLPIYERKNNNLKFKWISVAHFRIDKDYETLFKAIAILKHRNFEIDILGHTYNLDWPGERIKELGIEKLVNLLGFKSNVSDYLKKCDALILSSFSEGMPNAILEAMANGKPVVASDIQNIEEIFGDSNSGLLFKVGNAEDLAQKMVTVMEMSEEERSSMGFKGRELISEQYEEKIILKQWDNAILTQFT